jgi:hypothetical protein
MPLSRTVSLVPFEACAAAQSFLCSAHMRLECGGLVIDYSISGPLKDLIIPVAAVSPGLTPGLWQGTCCECFLRQDAAKSYTEWNFSPCGNWWVCVFDDYRTPARLQPQHVQPLQLDVQRTDSLLNLTAAIGCPAVHGLRIGPALILQHADGSRSHWAMAHSVGTPDFHNAATCGCMPQATDTRF